MLNQYRIDDQPPPSRHRSGSSALVKWTPLRSSVFADYLAKVAALVGMVEEFTRSIPLFRWSVGVTDDPTRRWNDHGRPTVWRHWLVEDEYMARGLERRCLAMGMRGGAGGQGHAKFLYVFLTHADGVA